MGLSVTISITGRARSSFIATLRDERTCAGRVYVLVMLRRSEHDVVAVHGNAWSYGHRVEMSLRSTSVSRV